jgi:hypothetical protein
MAYTVEELITRAFYLSQVVSREFETVSGQQLEDGLVWLNALLSLKSAHSRLIPYYTQYEFNAVIGTESYFVPNLVQPETLTFNIGPVRYSTMPQSRKPYFGSGRVDNIQSLPFNWHFERLLGGSDIYLYFVPDNTYPIKIWGKFGFADVALNQDLLTLYDEYYIDYLRYRLAMRICSEYGIPMQPQAMQELQEFEEAVTDVSPPDLTLTKYSSLQGETALNWGDINLGKGWRPGN